MPEFIYLSLFVVLLLSGSCTNSSELPSSFIDSLVESQVSALTASKATIFKTGDLSEKKDRSTFTPDRAQWENELDIFRQLSSFEKPAYSHEYEIKDHINDAQSNLMIRSYHSRKGIPVKDIRFYYYQNFDQLRKIEAVYQEKNALFSTKRKLVLEFDVIAGRFEISSYRIEGDQKIAGSDTVHFLIQSNIHH